MGDILSGIGLLIAAVIFGGAWQKKKQLEAKRKEEAETAARLEKGRSDAEKDFLGNPDAARDWLRKS